MASTKGRLVRLLSKLVLERAVVTEVQRIGGFRRLRLQWDGEAIRAGSKVQILLPTDDVRTYTPVPAPDGISLLGWTHGEGPGRRWLRHVQENDEVRFLAPQRSLELRSGQVVLVGDETSVAVAAALAVTRPGQVRAVIQSTDQSGVVDAASALGLGRVQVVPRGDVAGTVEAVTAALSIVPSAQVAVTGGSSLVIPVRQALRAAGVREIKTKTYWVPGRSGLD